MPLVIAEKSSVAMSIASVISADKRKDGYLNCYKEKSIVGLLYFSSVYILLT